MTYEDLIEYFGTQVAAAHVLGISQPTLANWKARGRIPALQQLRIEIATRGKLRADPDILDSGKVSRA